MLDKVRVRAFAELARELGPEELMDCLERNEQAGVVYHYPGQLVGDYDAPGDMEKIKDLVRRGR
jgi:hypothetical protein